MMLKTWISPSLACLLAAGLFTGAAGAPTHHHRHKKTSSWRARAYHHRQQTKNTWRNAAIGSAAVGAYGLVSHQSGLAALGAAGAVYSASRYEHDRRSQRALRSVHRRKRAHRRVRRHR